MTKQTDELKAPQAQLMEIVERNNAAEVDRVFRTFQFEYPQLNDVFACLQSDEDKRGEPPHFIQVVRFMMMQLTGRANFFTKRANPHQIRECFIQIFSCPYTFKRFYWELQYPSCPDLLNSKNIVSKETTQQVVGNGDLIRVRDLIADFLKMIGQLARQIHSCEMQRILRLIIATQGKPWHQENVSTEEAARLADEIIYCFDAIKAEINLLSPEERVNLCYPRIPHRRPDLIIHGEPPAHLTAEEKTKLCRDHALKKFREEHFMLLLHLTLACEEFDAVKKEEDEVNALAKTMRENCPILDRGHDEFDYKTLGDILSADFHLYYDRYYVDSDFDENHQRTIEYENHEDEIEETDQQKAKNRIITAVREILLDAIRLASECGSKSVDLWLEAQVLFEKRDGDFHSYSADDDDAAEADLRNFLKCLRQARQKLWADWDRHVREDITEKPIPTNPQGEGMDALKKDVRKERIATENELFYASGGEMGVGPTDARRKTLIRQQMTERGAELVRDKGLTAGQAAKKMIALNSGKDFAYTTAEETNLTREITRYCQENGIQLPNART